MIFQLNLLHQRKQFNSPPDCSVTALWRGAGYKSRPLLLPGKQSRHSARSIPLLSSSRSRRLPARSSSARTVPRSSRRALFSEHISFLSCSQPSLDLKSLVRLTRLLSRTPSLLLPAAPLAHSPSPARYRRLSRTPTSLCETPSHSLLLCSTPARRAAHPLASPARNRSTPLLPETEVLLTLGCSILLPAHDPTRPRLSQTPNQNSSNSSPLYSTCSSAGFLLFCPARDRTRPLRIEVVFF